MLADCILGPCVRAGSTNEILASPCFAISLATLYRPRRDECYDLSGLHGTTVGKFGSAKATTAWLFLDHSEGGHRRCAPTPVAGHGAGSRAFGRGLEGASREPFGSIGRGVGG